MNKTDKTLPEDPDEMVFKGRKPMLASLASSVFIPIFVGLILLFMEYRSGIFVPVEKAPPMKEIKVVGTIFMLFLISLSFLSWGILFTVWVGSKKYVREIYAACAAAAMLSLTAILAVSIFTRIMPWYPFLAIYQLIIGATIEFLNPPFADYIIILFVYFYCWSLVSRGYREWSGLKSLDEHIKEKDGRSTNMVHGTWDALIHIVKRQPFGIYHEVDYRSYLGQLQIVNESLSWKDQAKELLRLSTTVYHFGGDDWHDMPGCWIGRNIHTQGLVSLYPAYPDTNEDSIKKFIKYTERIAKTYDAHVDEFIVAVQGDGGSFQTINKKNGLPITSEVVLLDSLVDFRDYKNEILKRFEMDPLSDSSQTLKDVYVNSRYIDRKEGENAADDIESFIFSWLLELGLRQVAILGEYGQGKSTTALYLTHRLLTNPPSEIRRIPILIELRGKSPRNLTPLELLGAWGSQYRIDPQALMRLLIAGRLLLIFEGFDEMALVGDVQMRLAHFKTLWSFAYPRCKIIITGRPNFFLDEDELKAALGIASADGTRPYCEAIRLAPFDLSDMRISLRSFNPSIRDEICAIAARNARFKDLVSRPSTLYFVATLWEKENLSERIDRLNSAQVMDLFVRNSYRRQGLKEKDTPGFMALTNSERDYFMRGISTYMCSNQLPNQISSDQLNRIIDRLLDAIPKGISTSTTTLTGETTVPLLMRIEGDEYGRQHVQTDVRTCGLLVGDSASPGMFKFGHKSIQEYLFADVIANLLKEKNHQIPKIIMDVTGAKITDILNFPVSVEFLTDLIVSQWQDNNPNFEEMHGSMEMAYTDFSRKLLNQICGGRKLISRIDRFQLFQYALRRFAKYASPQQRIVAYLLQLPVLCVAAFSFGFIFILPLAISKRTSLFGVNGAFDIFVQILGILSILLLAISLLLELIMILYLVYVTLRNLNKQFSVWAYICNLANIPDTVLHKIAGTWYFRWARKQPFSNIIDTESLPSMRRREPWVD